MEMAHIKHILIIRSAPLERYYDIVARVRAEDFRSRIAVLTQKATADALRQDVLVDVYTYCKKKVSCLSVPMRTIWRLRQKRFDQIIILYTNPLGEGYGHVKRLGWILGAKETVAINNKGDVISFNWSKEFMGFVRARFEFLLYYLLWVWLGVVGRKDTCSGSIATRRQLPAR